MGKDVWQDYQQFSYFQVRRDDAEFFDDHKPAIDDVDNRGATQTLGGFGDTEVVGLDRIGRLALGDLVNYLVIKNYLQNGKVIKFSRKNINRGTIRRCVLSFYRLTTRTAVNLELAWWAELLTVVSSNLFDNNLLSGNRWTIWKTIGKYAKRYP